MSLKETARKIELACYKIRIQMRNRRQEFSLVNIYTAYSYGEVMPIAGPICEAYGISCGHVLNILGITIPKKNSKNRKK